MACQLVNLYQKNGIIAEQPKRTADMSQRGSQTIFKNIFQDQQQQPEPQAKKKGRSAALIAKRNECLIDRYFYYGQFSGLRYELILEALSVEFFLSEVTIPLVVEENLERLIQLKKEKPKKQYFHKKWPHLTWPF